MKHIIQNSLSKFGYQLTKIKPEDDSSLYCQCYPKTSLENRAFYNICAGGHFGFGGNFRHPLWTNIDVSFKGQKPSINTEKDIEHDLLKMKQLPIESNSAELFHSRFTLEHITDEAATIMFMEMHRCLKPGGICKIVVPNFELDYIAYCKKDYLFFKWADKFSSQSMIDHMKFKIPLNQASMEQIFIVHFAANASTVHSDGAEIRITDEEVREIIQTEKFENAMDYFCNKCSIEKQRKYRQNHISWWSYEKVERYFKNAGFKQIYPLSPRQSIAPVMRSNNNFDNLWNDVVLCMEAIK